MAAFAILFCILFAFLAVKIWQRFQAFQLRERCGLKGPPYSFISGNVNDILKLRETQGEDSHLFASQIAEKYGKVAGFYIGTQLYASISDLDTAREVFIKQFPNFTNREIHKFNQSKPFKDTLFNLEGDRWKNVRSCISPAFSTGKMRLMYSTINKSVDKFLEVIKRQAERKQLFDIYDDFQGLTLDTIGVCAFGMQSNCQTNRDDPFYVNVRKMFYNLDVGRSWYMMLCLLLPEVTPFIEWMRPYTNFGRPEKALADALERVVDERIKMYHKTDTVDIMQLLLDQSEECTGEKANKNRPLLTREEVIENCYTFLVAGYETTSTALAYTTFLLAKNPDCQDNLQSEIDNANSDAQAQEHIAIPYETLLRLPYLDAVFKESLRVYPPVIFFTSRTTKETMTLNGYTIPKGAFATIPVHAIHHNPQTWPDPETFKPERFLDQEAEMSRHPMAWMPFGHGPRNCVGLRFAEMNFKLTLFRLLSGYTLTLPNPDQAVLDLETSGVLLRPKNGVRMGIVER